MHLRRYQAQGYWWIGFEMPNGEAFLITRVGRVGDCVRF